MPSTYAPPWRLRQAGVFRRGGDHEVRGGSARRRGHGSAAGDGGSVEDGDDTDTTKEVALSSGILVAAASPIRRGCAAAHRGDNGRNKRKARSLPASAEANIGAPPSSGNRSSKTTLHSRVRAKRARRTGDDDVVVLEADDQQPDGGRPC